MVYNLLVNGVYWGYNPFTNHLLTSWDIQVLGISVSVHAMVKINCWKMKLLLLMQAPLIFRDELAVLFQGKVCNNIINIHGWSTYPHVRYPHEK